MPVDDDAYAKEVIRTVAELTKRTEETSQYLAQQLAIHRDIVFRAINLLNHEVIEFKDRLDKDDTARAERQKQIDDKLETITSGQQQIRRWQWIRLGVEIAAIAVAIAYLYGVSH